jgi:hypothetical protein
VRPAETIRSGKQSFEKLFVLSNPTFLIPNCIQRNFICLNPILSSAMDASVLAAAAATQEVLPRLAIHHPETADFIKAFAETLASQGVPPEAFSVMSFTTQTSGGVGRGARASSPTPAAFSSTGTSSSGGGGGHARSSTSPWKGADTTCGSARGQDPLRCPPDGPQCRYFPPTRRSAGEQDMATSHPTYSDRCVTSTACVSWSCETGVCCSLAASSCTPLPHPAAAGGGHSGQRRAAAPCAPPMARCDRASQASAYGALRSRESGKSARALLFAPPQATAGGGQRRAATPCAPLRARRDRTRQARRVPFALRSLSSAGGGQHRRRRADAPRAPPRTRRDRARPAH